MESPYYNSTPETMNEQSLKSLLKGEFSSLTISFNEHSCNYCDVKHAIEELGMYEFAEWVSEEEKQKAKDTNSAWVIHWYPNTPVGFNAVAASSLEVVLKAVLAPSVED